MNFFLLKYLGFKKYDKFYYFIKCIHLLKFFFIYTSIMNFSVTQAQNSRIRIWEQLYGMY